MSTVYLRRFAGLTSFDSNLNRSHLSVMGPLGIFGSNVMTAWPSLTLSTSVREVDPYGDQCQPSTDDEREHDAQCRDSPRVHRVIQSDRLKSARDPVPQVKADDEGADYVERHPQRLPEDFDLGPVQIADGIVAHRLIPGTVFEL